MSSLSHADDFGALLRASFDRLLDRDNLVPLLVMALAVVFGSVLTLGILGGPLALSSAHMGLRAMRGQPIGLEDIGYGFRRWLPAVVVAVLSALAFALGSVAIIFGLVAAFFFSFAFHVLAEHELSPVDALKESVRLVRDNLSDVVFLWLTLGCASALLSATVVGGIAVVMYGSLLSSALYIRIAPSVP